MNKDELMKLGLDEATAEKVAVASAEELKGFVPRETFETLQADSKNKDEAHAAEIHGLRVDGAVAAALTAAKAKNQKAVRALLELDGAELSDDGTIKGLDAQLKKLMESDDSKFLFDATTKPQLKGAKIGEEGVEGADQKVDTSKMSYDELCAYLADHPETTL